MANMVTINGASINADDPCALYQALYAAKLRLISGENVEEITLQAPDTREITKFTAANMSALNIELRRLQTLCDGKSVGSRIFNIQAKRGYSS
jgi:hypothetical protein